jgi:hypothetical protein
MILLRALLLLLCAVVPAQAARVVSVSDTGMVVLDDGRSVALAGVWVAPASLPTVQQVLVGQAVILKSETTDRHGVLSALLMLPDNTSIQAQLLRKGAAQVLPFTAPADGVGDLYGAEAAARDARAGLWGNTDTGVHTPTTIGQRIGHFAVAQGTVRDVATVKGTTYVNFGDDWRTDFTLSMPSGTARTLKAKEWTGKDVRARGWVQDYNGPLIAITDAQQVEPLFVTAPTKKVSGKGKRPPRDRAAKPRPRQGG